MNSLEFLKQFQERIVLGGANLEVLDNTPIRIQVGRDMAFKGIIQGGSIVPESDKLSESQIEAINEALRLSQDQANPAMQQVMGSRLVANFQELKDLPISEVYDEYADEIINVSGLLYDRETFEYPDFDVYDVSVKDYLKQFGVEPDKKSPTKTINIEIGDERIFRYSGKNRQVEVDTFNPVEVAVAEAMRDVVSGHESARQEEQSVDREQADEVLAVEVQPEASESEIGGDDAIVFAPGVDLSGRDLRGYDLSYADLRDANLSGANLTKVEMHGANLEGANLRQADLNSANLNAARLSGADLSGSILCTASLEGADLRRCELVSANLGGASLVNAKLQDANLYCANLAVSNLKLADLTGANLEGANLLASNLALARFDYARMNEASLISCIVFETSFTHSDMRRVYLNEAKSVIDSPEFDQGVYGVGFQSYSADFSHANLEGACLAKADLQGANFENASLCNSTLDYTNLERSNLKSATLSNARLEGTFMDGVCLDGAIGLSAEDVAMLFDDPADYLPVVLDAEDLEPQEENDRDDDPPVSPPAQPDPVAESSAIAPAENISSEAEAKPIVKAIDGLKERVSEAVSEAVSIAAENIAETVEKAKEVLPEPVNQFLDSASEKVPAAAIAIVELYDNLKEPAREWLLNQFEEVKESGLIQQLPEKGSEFVRASWQKLQQASRDLKDRAVADSVVALTKAFGAIEEGSSQFVYRAEEFTVRVEGIDRYRVENKKGQEILSFKYNTLTGPSHMQNRMSFADQFSFVQAGGELTRDRTIALTNSIGEKVRRMGKALGNLAPAGTKEKVEAFKQQQVSAVAKMMLNTSVAVESAGKKVFNGERFKFVQDSGVIQIFKNGLERQDKVFEQIGQTIRTRLEEKDAQTLINAGKAFIRAHSAARAKASQSSAEMLSQR